MSQRIFKITKVIYRPLFFGQSLATILLRISNALIVALFIFALALVIALSIGIRFTDSVLNYWFISIFCAAIPLAIILRSLFFTSISGKILGVVSSLPLAPILAIVVIFNSLSIEDFALYGYDRSFEKINEIRTGSSWCRLYRTDGGAMTSVGLLLYKEYELPIGLKLMKKLYYKDRSKDGSLTYNMKNGMLELKVEPYLRAETQQTMKFKIEAVN